MKTYYIYHIPGIKIGCTTNPKKRISHQKYTEWEILETHTNIHTAADREIELQKEYGYKVDLVRYDAVDYTTIGIHIGNDNKGGAKRTPILATNNNTNATQIFPSQMEASRQLGIRQCSIAHCLKGSCKQTWGYSFKYL
jgi:hypothetical protein